MCLCYTFRRYLWDGQDMNLCTQKLEICFNMSANSSHYCCLICFLFLIEILLIHIVDIDKTENFIKSLELWKSNCWATESFPVWGLHTCLVYLDQLILFSVSVMFNHALSQYFVYIWNLVAIFINWNSGIATWLKRLRMIIFFFFLHFCLDVNVIYIIFN